MTEDGADTIMQQAGIPGTVAGNLIASDPADTLVAVIVTLDEATTNSIKTSIGT
jgi:hypothetical protein